MNTIINLVTVIFEKLNAVGNHLSMLVLRLLLAWEFWESGVEKYRGENWFTDVQNDFPFPFNIIPTDLSWFLATWSEILGTIKRLE